MEIGTVLPVAFGLGFVGGLRSMTAPAAIAWGAQLGWLEFGGTPFSFVGLPVTTGILTLAALGEFVGDKLPKTPSRKAPGPFVGRVMTGALCGYVLGIATGIEPILPLIAGVLGAIAGTLGGYEARIRIPPRLKIKDFPYALNEDLIAVGLGLFLVSLLR